MLKCLPTGDSYSSQSASLTKTGRLSLLALACASLLSACNNNANPPPAASAPAPAITAPAAAPAEPVAAAYAPPSADVLYQIAAIQGVGRVGRRDDEGPFATDCHHLVLPVAKPGGGGSPQG